MEKLLSIIVPSYNMEKYLPKCLGSLIVEDEKVGGESSRLRIASACQGWTADGEKESRDEVEVDSGCSLLDSLDVIVVNDGSTDRTSEIAHDFERRYPGVFRVIDKENGHYGSCVNAALPIAKGEYVKVLDADDVFETGNIGAYLNFLQKELDREDGAPDLVFCDYTIVREEASILRSYAWCGNPAFNISRIDFEGGRDIWMHAIAFRRSIFSRFHYHQITGITHTDVQWLHTPMAYVERTAYCPVSLYDYYDMRVGNTSSPDAFYRTFGDLVTVTKQLISEYSLLKKGRTPIQESYLLQHLHYRIRRIYSVYLIERSPLLQEGVLQDFDAFLKKSSSELYEAAGTEAIGTRFRFFYVRDWRKKCKSSWRFKLYQLAQRIYCVIRGTI